MEFPPIPGSVFVVLLAVSGCVVLRATGGGPRSDRRPYVLFLVALSLRWALSLAIYRGGLDRVIGAGDDVSWQEGAALHEAWLEQGKGLLDLPAACAGGYRRHHQGYAYLLAVLFHFVRPAQLTAAALGGWFGAMATVLVYRTARRFASDRAAAIAGWLACLFPSLVLWSALTIKEPVVLFLSTLALHGAVAVRAGGFRRSHVASMALAVVLLVPFRFYAAYAVALAVFLGLILPRRDPCPGASGAGAGARWAAVLFAGLLLASGALAPRGGRTQAKFEDPSLGNLQFFRAVNGQRGTSAAPSTANLSTVPGFVEALTVGALHLLLAPLPWQTGGGGLRVFLAFPEMVLWWGLLLGAVLPGLRRATRDHLDALLPVLLYVVALGGVYCLLFSNIGLIFRQPSQLLPWLLALGAIGLDERYRAWLERRGGGVPSETAP
jgi:hypothetical protein